MSRIHNLVCSCGWWRGRVEHKLVPWGVRDVELGERLTAPVAERGSGSFRFMARKPA